MRYLHLIILSLSSLWAIAQSTDLPLNSRGYPILEEWDVKSEEIKFTAVKPISRRHISEWINGNNSSGTPADRLDLEYIRQETKEYLDSIPEKPGMWNTFFKHPSDFFMHQDDDFDLHVNPVITFGGGRDSQVDELIFENYRGLELRGTIDQKVGFYTLLAENQARYPEYVRLVTDSTLGVPYEGFWKQYRDNGVDFLRAQGYIDFNVSPHIQAQFGYGKHFIGNGRRSLILSDFSNNYPYFRLNTRIWKLQYTNIFAQLIGQTTGGSYGLNGTGGFPKKYFVNHHLSIRAASNLTIGLFESVIYGDSASTGIKVEYMNPIIFYRALEQQDGSADNVMLGLDFKWNLWKRISLYGQLAIDELMVSEVFNDRGWWGNKQGFQLGARYYDVAGIKDLNGQVEINRVNPYMYAHESNFTSYSHYNLALAHPLGANFNEVLLSANYRPLAQVTIQADLLMAQYGNDFDSLSYGRNILEPYTPDNRPGDYGHALLQGDKTMLLMFQGKISYHLAHNATVDLDAIWRKETSEMEAAEFTSSIFALTFRWNFPARSYLF